MKARLGTMILFAIYCAVAVLQGNCHQHGELTGVATPKHCSACHWQINSVADAPVVSVQIAQGEAAFPLSTFRSYFVSAFFTPSSASRAPPSVFSSNTVVG